MASTGCSPDPAPKTEGASNVKQLTSALGFFKDWTNYLVVTTVAALGWVTAQLPKSPEPAVVGATQGATILN
jgi:hypothetical protein